MVKEYYITYGIKKENLLEISKYLASRYDFEFSQRDSSYFGEYYKYKGLYADKITIQNNFNQYVGEYKYDSHKELKIIISIVIDKGKNKDKLSKFRSV